MTSLEPKPADSEATLLGQTVGTLQSDVKVEGARITGTLHYVSGYTGFSGTVGEQEGNYLALDFSDVADDVTIKHHSSTGKKQVSVTRDETGRTLILLVKEDTKAKLGKFTFSKGGTSVDKVFDLSGLTLEAKG